MEGIFITTAIATDWFSEEWAVSRAVKLIEQVEAEVRKDDEALIRQMLESMCWAARVMTISEDEAPGYFAAIAAARARLEEKPCAYRTTQL